MNHSQHTSSQPTPVNYLPLLVVFAFIFGGTALLQNLLPGSDWMRTLMFFEGLMLSFFALFKLLDLKGFQEGYANYDIITKQIPLWGYVYPFLELGLGVLLLLNIGTFSVSIFVAFLAIIGLISVSIELKKDRKIQCACLGTALNVPLTQVSLIENGIMLVLALLMAGNLYQTQINTHSLSYSMTSNGMMMNHMVNITNDKQFLEHMVPHHQDAVDSSRIVANRTQNPRLKELAQTIVAAQTTEITEMKDWYKQWYGSDFPTSTSYMAMMSNFEKVPLEDLDDLYLSEMIMHHQNAIGTAAIIEKISEHSEVKNLAQNIQTTQRQEIETMRGLVKNPAAINMMMH